VPNSNTNGWNNCTEPIEYTIRDPLPANVEGDDIYIDASNAPIYAIEASPDMQDDDGIVPIVIKACYNYYYMDYCVESTAL
jgi:hypothetical protein